MSRWFVGSSSSSRSGCEASARASEARVSSPPENVDSGRSRSSSVKPSPRTTDGGAVAPVVAAGVLEPRLRRRVARQRLRGRARRRPSPARARAAPPRARRGRPCRRARTRAAAARSSPAAAGRAARRASPFSHASSPPSSETSPMSARSSVVLPAPFGPASASRSRRSTLNETPSKSGAAGDLLAEVGCDQDCHAAVFKTSSGRPRRAWHDSGA